MWIKCLACSNAILLINHIAFYYSVMCLLSLSHKHIRDKFVNWCKIIMSHYDCIFLSITWIDLNVILRDLDFREMSGTVQHFARKELKTQAILNFRKSSISRVIKYGWKHNVELIKMNITSVFEIFVASEWGNTTIEWQYH